MFSNFRKGVFVASVIAIFGLGAVLTLAWGVAQDLNLLSSARSDNVQWSLSQTEVEFLEFEREVMTAQQAGETQLSKVRREFDIFFSRVNTLNRSSTYATLRGVPEFAQELAQVQGFLDATVPLIDANDANLRAALPGLQQASAEIRAHVRALSNSGLKLFAAESDRRREGVTGTLIEMAVVVAALMLALGICAIYMTRLFWISSKRQQQAQNANDRMNVVIESSLDGVIVADTFGRILAFNPAAEQIFGHQSADAIGANLAELIIPDHFRDAHAAGMKRMRDNGEKRVVGKGRVKLEAKRADGSIFPVELAIQSAETAEGPVFVAFLRDLTLQVEAEEELVQARDRAVAGEKAKTDFMATMSHEIRTPLNGLLGNLSLLEETNLDADQRKYITHMHSSGRLLMSHVSDVLDITKYDAGKLQLRPVDMNLSDLIGDIVDNQRGAAAANMTSVAWDWIGTPITWISADQERLQHILMNLIGNAVKFTSKGSVVVLAEETAPNMAKITVKDTGIGISPELQARIFDDFVTGDTSYGREVGGTGLGLGIARRFVEALGGEIGVESRENQGSQFWVTFPFDPAEAPKEIPQAPQSGLPIGGTALLVEDNEINRFVAHEMLKTLGYQVTEAENGAIGVERAEAEKFDLIFMDISMPVMDGRSATKAIRGGDGNSKDSPIIALTANAMAAEQEAFMRDGMNAILTKPLTRDALRQVLANFASDAVRFDNVPEDLRDMMETDELAALLKRFDSEGDEFLEWAATDGAENLADLQMRSHKMAGSAAIFGPPELREALITLEQAAKSGDADASRANIEQLCSIWQTTRPIRSDG